MAAVWDDFKKLRELLGEMGHASTSKARFATLRREALQVAHRLGLEAAAGTKLRKRAQKRRHTYSPKIDEKTEAKARAEAAERLRPKPRAEPSAASASTDDAKLKTEKEDVRGLWTRIFGK